MAAPRSTVYRFGPFHYDAATGELAAGHGRRLLAPTPGRVLELLLARAGELVSREELYDALWGELHVDAEHGLNSCILQLRRALDDDARSPRFIETVRGRGYRLKAPVSTLGSGRRSPRRAAAAVVAFLVLLLTASARHVRPAHSRPAALAAYVEGGYLASLPDPDALARAVESFSRALSVDPGFVPARAALAETWVRMARAGLAPTLETLDRAAAEAARALVLDPADARASLALGLAELYSSLDWRRAAPHFAHAASAPAAEPEARLWHARSLAALGDADAAVAEAEALLVDHPAFTAALFDLGWFYYLADRIDEAAAASRRVLEIEPDAWQAWRSLLASELLRGHREAAAEAARHLTRTLLGRAPAEDRPAGLDAADPERVLRATSDLLRDACPTRSLALERAQLLSLLGEREAALAALRSGIERRLFWSPFVAGDPAFAALRADPRFATLIAGDTAPRG